MLFIYLFNMKFVQQYTAKTLVKKIPQNNGRKHNIILGSTTQKYVCKRDFNVL